MDNQHVTNLIIGFGKAGRALARSLSRHGQDALIVEKYDYMYGGTCPNVGCAPSKTLIVAGNQNLPFPEAMARKYRTVGILHQAASGMALNEERARAITGTARFLDSHRVEVSTPDGQGLTVEAEHIFINTGATPVIPDIEGLRDSRNVVTSEGAMELRSQPKRLVIIGAGNIGLEFAGMFSRFGSLVTVLQHDGNFLAREDDDVATQVKANLQAAGVDIRLDTVVTKLEDVPAEGSSAQTKVSVRRPDGSEDSLLADVVLVATGRKPNVDDLDLAAAGVEQVEHGYIRVRDDLRTTVDHIWALGDVRGGGQHYYLSTDDFRIVDNHLFGDGSRRLSDRVDVPYSVFVSPTLSRVGLNEKQAQAAGRPYRLFKMSAAGIVKSRVYEDPRGLLKALVDPDSGLILGASLYHEDSHEVIGLISLAMKAKVPYTVLRDQIFVHPTMGEALNDLFAAEQPVGGAARG